MPPGVGIFLALKRRSRSYVALATLKSTEHILAKDPEWAEKFKAQIQDTLDRNVARMLSNNERPTGMVQSTT